MSTSALVVAFVGIFVALVSGQAVILNGECPNWTPQQNLESARLSGDWIGLYGLENDKDKAHSNCLKLIQVVTTDGVFNTTIQSINPNKEKLSKNVIGTPIDGQAGKLVFKNAENPEEKIGVVLNTDYDNYSVMTLCKNEGGKHGFNVFVFTRQSTLSPELLAKAKAAISAANINQEVQLLDQINC